MTFCEKLTFPLGFPLFFLLIFRNSLYMMDTSPLSDVSTADILEEVLGGIPEVKPTDLGD